jgi:hypothetical protein
MTSSNLPNVKLSIDYFQSLKTIIIPIKKKILQHNFLNHLIIHSLLSYGYFIYPYQIGYNYLNQVSYLDLLLYLNIQQTFTFAHLSWY